MNHSEIAASLELELDWCAKMIDAAIKLYFGQDCAYSDVHAIEAPDLSKHASPYASLIQQNQLGQSERLVVILALAPHLRPQMLDTFLIKNSVTGRGFTEFGGIPDRLQGGFYPTIETAAFILAGTSLERRFAFIELFSSDSIFYRQQLLEIPAVERSNQSTDTLFSAPLKIHPDQLTCILTGKKTVPVFSVDFPAQQIKTALTWDDLVLPESAMREVQEVCAWINHGRHLMSSQELAKYLQPGYRSIFYGPPGTGKKLAASLLGKASGSDVLSIDISLLTSIPSFESERILTRLLERAVARNEILLIENAETLFADETTDKTQVRRPSNQAAAYLLQSIQHFPGVVILTARRKNAMDPAWMQYFDSVVYFPVPATKERLQLWRNTFRAPVQLDANVDLQVIAEQYEITGGAIANVLRRVCLMVLQRGSDLILQEDLLTAIRREMQKNAHPV